MAGEKKTKVMFAVLIIAVLVLASVLGMIWFNKWNAGRQTAIYQAGYQQGAAAAIIQVIQKSRDCQIVPLFAGNVTYSFVDVGCLKK